MRVRHARAIPTIFAAVLALTFLVGSAPAFAAAEEKDVSIPLASLVLFTSGVGYYQHEGVVEGNARMELTFSASQINDLLKSLVLRDLDGGSISSVTYSSRDPISRALKGFSIDLTANPTLADLLGQARGEAVEVMLVDDKSLAGTIISVESRESQSTTRGYVSGQFLNLSTRTGIKSIALSDLQGIQFVRKEVQDDLAQALALLSSSHGIEKKKVVLHFSGTGRRRVRIGYILESPVWKTSYRLVLGDSVSHFLQGWAMVENTSDTDWKEVSLSLVSGRPITFIMNLYQPLYIQRPEVQLELYQSLLPRTNQMAMEEAQPEAMYAESESGMGSAPAMAAAPKSAPAPRESDARSRVSGAGTGGGTADFSVSQGVAAAAQGAEVGNLFQYAIEKPLTLPRQQSAMLPIVNQTVGGERYSLYNEATHPKYPLHAVKLKNSSGLHLMQGPITVFDGGTYAGDAQITDLAPSAEQLVSYALDLDTEVEPVPGGAPQTLVSVKIAKGIFTFTNKLERERIYNIRNRDTKGRAVLIEYPFQPEWTLVEPKEPAERTRDSYRFAVPVAAGKSGKLSVVEMRMVEQSVALTNLQNDGITIYIKSTAVSQAVRSALQKLLELRQKLSEVVDQRVRQETRVNEISRDQERIRANMDRLSQTSDLYKNYVKTLTNQEEELSRLREEIAKLREQESARKKDVDTFILSIDVK